MSLLAKNDTRFSEELRGFIVLTPGHVDAKTRDSLICSMCIFVCEEGGLFYDFVFVK